MAYWGWVRDSAAARLVASSGRSLAELAADARRREFTPVPLPIRLDATLRVSSRPVPAVNVLAKLPGRGPRAGESLVFGAHYDHEGIGRPENGDSIYNGAEDNASGTAAMLGAAEGIARSGARPSRTIVFAAFIGEEEGLLGSEALVLAPPAAVGKVVGMVNADYLNLYGRTRDIGTLGNDLSTLGDALAAAARAESLTVRVDPDDIARSRFFRSDNYPFARAGIPAHPHRERRGLRGPAGGVGPRAAGAVLERAVPSAGRPARRLDVGRRARAAGTGGRAYAARAGRRAARARRGSRVRTSR